MPESPDDPKPQLLTDPVGRTLLRMAGPMAIGIASIMLFHLVDTLYVGQLGPRPLAAMSFTFPVVFIVLAFSVGMGIGTTAVISRTLGSGDKTKARRVTTHALLLALIIVSSMGVIGLLTIRPLFRLLGAPDDLIPLIREYMTPWFAGVGMLVAPIVGNSAIRSTGNTRTPMFIMLVAGGVNIVLDPFLIFGMGPFPRLGLQGAAVATVVGWVATLVMAGWALRREELIELSRPKLTEVLESWRELMKVSLPAALTQTLMPIGAAIFTRLVAAHGEDAVAAYGIGARVESLSMIGIMAVCSANYPFSGQNYGAGAIHRIRESLAFCVKVSLVWGVGIAALLALIAPVLADMFTDDARIIEIATTYMRIMPLSYAPLGLVLAGNAIFNATSRPLPATAVTSTRLFLFGVPCAWLGSALWGHAGIFVGIAVANSLAGLIALAAARRYLAGLGSPGIGASAAPEPASLDLG